MKQSLEDFRRKYPNADIVSVGPSVRLTPAVASVALDGGTRRVREKTSFVRESISVDDGKLTIVCAVEATNEANQRQWRARNRRMGAAWRAVRHAIAHRLDLLHVYARHLTAGGTLKVLFVRIGGRKVDKSGLGNCTKGVEDAICYLLGCDDGDDRWDADWGQEPGEETGVRIEVTMS